MRVPSHRPWGAAPPTLPPGGTRGRHGKRPVVEPIAGSCLCGAVTFSVEPPTLFAWHCHCSICRRAHGAAYATWTGVKSHQLTIVTGYEDLVSYPSSPWAVRRFCRHCGSPLFYNADSHPGEVHVAVASLSWPLDRLPDRHVFFEDQAPWADVSDRLPRYDGPGDE